MVGNPMILAYVRHQHHLFTYARLHMCVQQMKTMYFEVSTQVCSSLFLCSNISFSCSSHLIPIKAAIQQQHHHLQQSHSFFVLGHTTAHAWGRRGTSLSTFISSFFSRSDQQPSLAPTFSLSAWHPSLQFATSTHHGKGNLR